MLAVSRPMRAQLVEGWAVTIDAQAGGEWVRVRLLAPDGSNAARSDTAMALAALDAARALLVALGARDTTIADAAELTADARAGDTGALSQLGEIASSADAGDEEALEAAGHLLDASDAAELLDGASSGDAEALERVAQITTAADDGDEEAAHAERHLCAPALVGFPTLDLGTVDLGREQPAAGIGRRLRAALEPMSGAARLATATMRAIGRGLGA